MGDRAGSGNPDHESPSAPLRVLAVNLYYAPDIASSGQILADLCEGLAERGLEVTVVAGQPSSNQEAQGAPVAEELNGVQVRRVSLGSARGREQMRTRLIGYARFMWHAWRTTRALVDSERPDVVLTLSNPPIVGLIGAWMAWRRGVRYVYVLTDIHPDLAVASGWVRLPGLFVRLWDAVSRWILMRADTVVVLGESMRDTLVKTKGVHYERVQIISLWGRPELKFFPRARAVRAEMGIDDNGLLLLHAGNMGIMHPLHPILDAAAAHRDAPVRFLFLGDGVRREALADRAKEEQLSQVTFLPYQSEERFRELLAASDACFVPLEPGMERFAVPSRAYTFLSAGRPLIAMMAPDADVAKIVRENECGWNVTTGLELAALIGRMLDTPEETLRRGQRGRAIYEQSFLRDRAIDRYAELLNQSKSASPTG